MAAHQLVDMREINPRIQFDIVYATPNNFTGQVLYPIPACFMHREPAEALNQIQQDLERRGLCLKIYDGYRPISVQQKMWDLIRDDRYVGNPATNRGGRHPRGVAVDVTLLDCNGNELKMPTLFDSFSEKAHSTYLDLPELILKNRTLLFEVMGKRGFTPLPTEWWHFDYHDWNNDTKFPAWDIPLDQL